MVCHPSKDWYVKADLQSETESPRLLYRRYFGRASKFGVLKTPESDAGWCGRAIQQSRHVRNKAARLL
jgi:hypothetical protein